MDPRVKIQRRSVPHEEAGLHILLYNVHPGKVKPLDARCAKYTRFRPIESCEIACKE